MTGISDLSSCRTSTTWRISAASRYFAEVSVSGLPRSHPQSRCRDHGWRRRTRVEHRSVLRLKSRLARRSTAEVQDITSSIAPTALVMAAESLARPEIGRPEPSAGMADSRQERFLQSVRIKPGGACSQLKSASPVSCPPESFYRVGCHATVCLAGWPIPGPGEAHLRMTATVPYKAFQTAESVTPVHHCHPYSAVLSQAHHWLALAHEWRRW